MTADHAGVDLKDELAAWLGEQGHDVIDLGTNSHESVDYPRFGAMLAEALADRPRRARDHGLRVGNRRRDRCQSQPGVPLRAGRRAAVGDFARKHNDANAIALGARLIGVEMAKACVTAFLDTDFAGGRHQRRVDQLSHILQESD